MTRQYCDQCKRVITRKNGPVFVSYVHHLGGPTLCLPCFSKETVWKSLQAKAQKEIDENIAFSSRLR